MKWTGSRRLFSRFGLTLIEVLASVVILAVAGTAALFAVESIQAGQLKEAEYADALGLATTIAEEIKDRDPG
ncbi:prepilin-type N-terminal cleavage/methylation domain-containing protein, partial [Alicyclobacillus mali (ex Roth et al. 2021)]|uniref:type II secretion system protein n=1 Tax=Alicyclobacillus mali (ex Roth et al. 2021) TaxID=1123961 RepID=UPI0023F0E272